MTEKKLEWLLAEPSPEARYSKGDFGAKVEGGKLLLPGELYAGLTNNGNLRSAEEIVAIFEYFPSYQRTVAEKLGWSEEEVRTAYQGFVALVRPHIDPQFFEKREPIVRGMGIRKSPVIATQEAYVDALQEQLEKDKN